MLEQLNLSIANWFARRAGGNLLNSTNSRYYNYLIDKPAWLALSTPRQYREAVSENPILNGCISILSKACANGKKYLVDQKGKEISWDSRQTGVQNARRLFLERPNPLQSVNEFNFEHYYMFNTFGNNYVYANNPLESFDTDINTVITLYNLPSEYVEIKQTGRLYDQVDISGIIEKYILNNYNPVKEFFPKDIIHFNDLNTSGIGTCIIGTSKLEVLRYPITNTQLAFEAMNVILKSRGMQGIIKANNKDGTGTQIPLNPVAKKEIDDVFKNEYGIRENQKQFLISYSDIDYIKTIFNSQELGIYDEFSNNAMIICNQFGVPHELYKTYMKGSTFENQIQSVRRLYQDAVIPIVENDDQFWTSSLNMRKYGFELRTDWSHIPALAEAQKEKATAASLNARAANIAYNDNTITWNQYLEMIGLESIPGGDIYKFERIGIPDANPVPIVEPQIQQP